MTMRAQLGIDGNCGFALLGDDIQSGEAEFVEIDYNAKEADGTTVLQSRAERTAAAIAFRNLKERLGDKELSYYLGASHPFNR